MVSTNCVVLTNCVTLTQNNLLITNCTVATNCIAVTNRISANDFQLAGEHVRTRFIIQADGFDLQLSSGMLRLPDFFTAGLCDGNGPTSNEPAFIEIRTNQPLRVAFGLMPGQGNDPPSVSSVTFSGALALRNLGVKVPKLNGLAGELCEGTLVFPEFEIANQELTHLQLPRLTNLLGQLQIPLPPGQTTRVDIVNAAWSLSGFPSGTIRLGNDLKLIDHGGFELTLLGATNTECKAADGTTPLATGITVFPGDEIRLPPVLPSFRLDGGMRVALPLSALTTTSLPPDRVTGTACGSLIVKNGTPPELVMSTVAVGGTFHLGRNGPVIRDARLSFEQIQNIFQLGNGREALVRLGGTLQIPQGPSFTLNNARFAFFDARVLPRFAIDGMTVDNRNFTLMQRLPVRVQQATFRFRDSNKSIEELFRPENIEFKISADVAIPPTGQPYFTGRVDDLEVDFSNEGIPQLKGIDGFGMGVGGLKMPPIKELGGRIFLGGLRAVNDSGLPDLNRIFLVGRLGGSYQGYQVIFQAAFTLQGPVGMCVDVNAGSIGIPLGPTGFLFTGASGGISYVNSNGDPCDFQTYFARDTAGNLIGPSTASLPVPSMSWDQLRQMVQRIEAQEAIFTQFRLPQLGGAAVTDLDTGKIANSSGNAVTSGTAETLLRENGTQRSKASQAFANSPSLLADGEGGEIPCPGDCPPPTVNIFCQPHPDQDDPRFVGKVIAKFSSIDEPTLNALGVTRELVRRLEGNLAQLISNVAHTVRTNIEALTPPPISPPLSSVQQQQIQAVMTLAFDSLESGLRSLLDARLRNSAGDQHYDAIRDLVHEGLPCPDETLTVSGTLSYTGISTFASVTGKGIVSTAGAAGVIGTLNLIGVPVGEAELFVAATDAQGDPNPSLCGRVAMEFGPLSIGDVRLAYECPGCVSGVLRAFATLAGALSVDLVKNLAVRVAPDLAVVSLTKNQIISALTLQQRLGFMAELAHAPAILLPPGLPQLLVTSPGGVWEQIDPRVTFCGAVQPKLFGLPITPKAVAFSAFASKSEEAGSFQFSPSMLLSNFLPIYPADEATMTFDVQYPDAAKFLLGGLAGQFATPQSTLAYAKENLDYLLQNTAFGLDYTFSPFGLRVATAQARVIIPNLTEHPARFLPNDPRHWKPPEEVRPPTANLPSRQDLLLAAAANGLLGNAFSWKGTADDLFKTYPQDSPARTALAGRSLARDYFPHGGLVGAGLLTVPRLLTATPPYSEFNTLANQSANPLDRLGAAAKIFSDYILRTETNGTLAFYVPAPNPPIFFGTDGQPLGQQQLNLVSAGTSPGGLLDSIKSFDAAKLKLGSLYPVQYAFLRGYVDGQLLGVPIARADVLGVPPGTTSGDAHLLISAAVAQNSWVQHFVNQAELKFEVRQSPSNTVAKRFSTLLAQINALRTNNASQQARLAKTTEAINSIAADMPKVSLEAALQNLKIPLQLAGLLAVNGSTSGRLVAYSPRFEPTFPGAGPLAEARRNGGIALVANLRLGSLISIPNAELSLKPQPSGLPVLDGQFSNVGLNLPGGVSFSGGQLDFTTAPVTGQPFFSARGSLSPINIGPLPLGIVPLNASASALTGTVQIIKSSSGSIGTTLLLGPAQLNLPKIGIGQTIRIYGSDRTQPFGFSTTGPWTATLSLEGGIRLFDTSGLIEVLRIASTTPIVGSITGNGLNSGAISVDFPSGVTLTAFPALSSATPITLSAGSAPKLIIRSDGTFNLTGRGGLQLGTMPLADASLNISESSVAVTDGSLAVPGLPVLKFSGQLRNNGTIELASSLPGSTAFSNFPFKEWTTGLRRAPGDYRAAVLSDAPVGYWQLGEKSASEKAADISGNGAHGIYQGGAVAGQKGALSGSSDLCTLFDGQSGYVSLGKEDVFRFTTALSIEAWIKTSGFKHDWEAIVTKGDSSWRLSRYANSRRVSFECNGGGTSHSLPSARNVDDGQWHHLVGVYDGFAKYLYIDGVLEAVASYTQVVDQNKELVFIGENSEARGRNFNGSMDEVALYNRALGASQVVNHFQAGGGTVLSPRLKLDFPGELGSIELTGSMAPNGALSLQASGHAMNLRGFNFNNSYLTLAHASGGGLTVNLAGDLSLPVLDAPSARFRGNLPGDGALAFGVGGIRGSILGFSFNTLNLDVSGNVKSAGSLAVSGQLGIPNVSNFSLGGTISTAGKVSLDANGNLSLAGFTGSGGLQLGNSGLTANATLALDTSAGKFGNATFSGSINNKGDYDMGGSSSVSMIFGGFNTSGNASLRLRSAGTVSGNASLILGDGSGSVSVPVEFSLGLGGILSFSGSLNLDTGWMRLLDAPNPGFPNAVELNDVFGRVAGSAGVSSSASGVISAAFSGTFGWWIVTQDCNVKFGERCHPIFAPDLSDPSFSQKHGISLGLGADGEMDIQEKHGGLDVFQFNLW